MSTMTDAITISRRFRGPPESANGGYACGLIASRLERAARVRLHHPPPLEEPLTIGRAGAAPLALLRGKQVIAEGIAAEPQGDIPEPVSYDSAVSASTSYRWITGHPFPGCFVCGPERHRADGLCIFPGRAPDRTIVAAPWVPDSSVCDATGRVRVEVLWAALDCPSWFGVLEFEHGASVALLGELTARVLQRPLADEPCVVIGWSRGREGRKLYGGAALYTGEGRLIGNSDAVWIAPKA